MNGTPRAIDCSTCGAPVALSVASVVQQCPSCRNTVVLPIEVEAHLVATQKLIGDKLALASELDAARGKVMRTESGAMLFVAGLVLVSCGGLQAFAGIWPVIDKGWDAAWPGRIVPAAAGITVALFLSFLALAIHRVVRRRLWRTFAAAPPEPGAPHGSCHACGGPLPPSSAGSVRCAYCRCDNVLGRDTVVLHAVDMQARLVAHADDMLKAMQQIALTTRVLGYAVLLLLPLLSGGVWLVLLGLLAG